MNPTQLLSHFDRISDAPDAIQRLRRVILNLAVRGKLVPQDPSEMVGEFIPEIRPQLEAYDAPENWRWTELGEVAAISGGFAFKSSDYAPSGIFVLRVTNIEPSGAITKSDAVFLPKGKVSSEIERFYLNAGDILLVMVGGSLGKIGIVTPDTLPALLNQNLWRITPASEEVDRHFLKLLIDFVVSFQRKITHSTHGHLSREDFRKKSIPLPPLAEQRRIVAKVDELMALCDKLEAAKTERESRRDRLVASSLHHLSNGVDTDAFRDHARFYFNHLPRLTTRTEHIQQLRQTILNLAVRGKLVPQDPNDEPATQLLKHIQSEKAQRVKNGSLREQKQLEPIDEEQTDFVLPLGWQWSRMANVIKLWNGYAFKSADFQSNGVPVIRIGDLQRGEIVLSGAVCVPEIIADTVGPEVAIPDGALLIAMSGATTGKVAFNRTGVRALLNQRVGRIEVFLMSTEFIKLFFETIVARNLSIAFGTAIPNLSAQQINETVVPIPPHAEQQRIVAKVDELMALCNKLDTQLTTTHTDSRRLLDAVLHEALAS